MAIEWGALRILSSAWSWLTGFFSRYKKLEMRVAALESAKDAMPRNPCPSCGVRGLRMEQSGSQTLRHWRCPQQDCGLSFEDVYFAAAGKWQYFDK